MVDEYFGDFIRGYPIINTDDLGVVVGGCLEEVGGVAMAEDIDIEVQFFFPFTFQAIGNSFTIVEAATGEFCNELFADEFFVYKYFALVEQDAINADVEAVFH